MMIGLPGYVIALAARMLIGMRVGVWVGLMVGVKVVVGFGVWLGEGVTDRLAVRLGTTVVALAMEMNGLVGSFAGPEQPVKIIIRTIPRNKPVFPGNDNGLCSLRWIVDDDMLEGL